MNVYDILIEMWRTESRHDNRKQVRDFISNIASVAEHDPESTFIYRGESECHDRVSSGLYRQFHELDDEFFDIMKAQERQLEVARRYSRSEEDDHKILAQIQHRGGKTNLIDFTADLNIALFFACNYSQEKDGRVVFLRRQQWDDYGIQPAIQPSNMADAQKSCFVTPTKGYIKDEDITVYEIPGKLKAGILQHLQIVYGIEPSTVYNDISGFIRDQHLFPDFEADFCAGERYLSEKDYGKAICFYTKGLQNPTVQFMLSEGTVFPNVHRQRGIANYYAGNRDDALDDLQIFDSHGGDWKEKPEIPQEIRNWFNKNKGARQEEKERQRELQRANDAGAAAGVHSICVEAKDPDGNFVDEAKFKLLSEDSYEDYSKIHNGSVQVPIPGECHGSNCLFWFNLDGYRGVNPVQVQLGDSFTETLKPEEANPDAPEVTIKVTYKIKEAT